MTLSLCLPYYRNPLMLEEQYRIWCAYPPKLRARVEIVLVDDGSPAGLEAAAVPRPSALPPIRIYRVLEDIPWHQHGARNLAASHANCPWLFLTDMDHVLPTTSLDALLEVLEQSDETQVYTFYRVDAPNLEPTRNERGELKPHVNTFAVSKAHFWHVGGYDEDCVGYGTDSYFRRRLFAHSQHTHLHTIPIVRYAREVIPDASTAQTGVDPRALRNAGRRTAETKARLERKAAAGLPPKVLDFPWERVF